MLCENATASGGGRRGGRSRRGGAGWEGERRPRERLFVVLFLEVVECKDGDEEEALEREAWAIIGPVHLPASFFSPAFP